MDSDTRCSERVCPACYGTGKDLDFDSDACGMCGGTGKHRRRLDLSNHGAVLTFEVPSATTDLIYRLHVYNGRATCSCLGWATHGQCKHTKEALMGAITGEAISAALTVRRDDPTAMVVPLKREELMPTEKQMSLMFKIATTVVKARGAMVPASCDTPEKAFGLILAGHELGLAPMTALRHMYAVNGVTQPDTQVMMGVVRSKDPSITFSFPEYTETAVTCIMRRRGQDPLTIRYTVEDAKRSGQMGKAGPWTQYTRDMLSYSCAKRCVKLGAPDLLNLGGDIPLSMATAMADAIRDSEPEIAADDVPLESIPAEAYNPGDEPEPPVVDAEPADDAPELAGQFVAMLAERGADVDGDFPRWAVAYFGGGAIPSLFTSAEPARLNNAIGALKVASKRDMTAAQAQYDAWRVKQAPAPVGEVARA